MRYRSESPEVFYLEGATVQVTTEDVEFLKQQASKNPRKRARLCLHRDPQSDLHEMLIVHLKDVYVRPHKHLGREESFQVLEGEAAVLVFDDTGNILEQVVVGPSGSGRPFYFRMRESLFHMLLIKSDVFVFQEVTRGPFDRGSTEFAAWAPADHEAEAITNFLAKL